MTETLFLGITFVAGMFLFIVSVSRVLAFFRKHS